MNQTTHLIEQFAMSNNDMVIDDGLPYSKKFDDIYFSRSGGQAETDYVFLQHNNLSQRFSALDPLAPGVFTLYESGFGTGLNFLMVLELWLNTAPTQWRLCYLASEKYPLSPQQLKCSLDLQQPPLKHQDLLEQHYPEPVPGFHSRDLCQHRVRLQLLYGDNNIALAQLHHATQFKVDAWLLDGFSPSNNPGMWDETSFGLMQSLSKPGATFATFTAAGFIRRGLLAHGWQVLKAPGFGRKREMLHGHFVGPELKASLKRGWLVPAAMHNGERQAIIIGGGLAGSACAWALAKRGWRVQILEPNTPLQSASANPQAVLHCPIDQHIGDHNFRNLQQYLFAAAALQNTDLSVEQPGVFEIASTEYSQELTSSWPNAHYWMRILNRQEQQQHVGLSIDATGVFFNKGLALAPSELCRAWQSQSNIEVINQRLQSLLFNSETQSWQLRCASGLELNSPVVINTTGINNAIKDYYQQPVQALRGQFSLVAATPYSQQLRCIINNKKTFTPPFSGQHFVGASFSNSANSQCNAEEHQDNMQDIKTWSPEMFSHFDNTKINGGVAFRPVSRDRNPIVGGIPEHDMALSLYRHLHRNARTFNQQAMPYHTGLYTLTGLGSRGLLNATSLGEYLACLISGEASPLPWDLVRDLNPGRFLISDIKKRRIIP